MGKTSYYHYSEDDIELIVNGSDYSVDVIRATATGWYAPATRVDPEENEFEIDEVEAVWHDVNGDVVEPDEAMEDALTAYLEDQDWDRDDPPEPDYDDYEEREIARWERGCDEAGV